MRRGRSGRLRAFALTFVATAVALAVVPAPAMAVATTRLSDRHVMTAAHLAARSPTLVLQPDYAFPTDADAYGNALRVFAESGLGIPLFRIEFHDRAEPCNGYGGIHNKLSDSHSLLHVCVSYARPNLRAAARERAVMHEVAHAWLAQNLTDQQQEDFVALRRLETWRDRSAATWDRLGCEHAAEILLWGITDGEYRIDFKIQWAARTNPDLAGLYQILVGQPES